MKKTLLVIAISLALTACGSSGTSTSRKVVDKPTNPVSSKKDNVKEDVVNKDDVKEDVAKKDDVKENVVNAKEDVKKDVVKKDHKPKSEEKVNIEKIRFFAKYPNTRGLSLTGGNFENCSYRQQCKYANANLNSVKLKGVEVLLLPSNQNDDFYFTIAEKSSDGNGNHSVVNNAIIGGVKYKYSRFALTDPNLVAWQAISQGVVTKDMPMSGVVTYKGEAIGFKGDVTDKMTTGESTVLVDFGGKNLNGYFHKWTDSKMPVVNFQADIKGNEFIKQQIYKWKFRDKEYETIRYSVKGRFYGKNAAEIGGVVMQRDNSKYQHTVVAFGGKKNNN